MKQCPQCKQTYSDENLNFCLSDGTTLISLSASSFEETTVYHSPVVQQTRQPTKQGVNPLLIYSIIALLALIVGGGIVFLLRPSNAVSSVSPAKAENSTPLPSPKSEETFDLEGIWAGTFSNKPATLVFKKAEGKNKYSGILSRTSFEIAIDAYVAPDVRQISFEEKNVIKGKSWGELGTSKGLISVDGKSMTGGGRDEYGKSYSWSFTKR